ncbi:hypothetical protein GTV32_16050 [Gordonia sp. SID5947]|uniref:hypothetical protein n=1 Tax=Gordonia sp. SID5947 TaxID=2690315 RepID=UPI00136C70AC|nr:hypothetical protein [Gordonia sp. SID5947]MYR07722.1 hypothetical protein [Gordonia sp. SID5947]
MSDADTPFAHLTGLATGHGPVSPHRPDIAAALWWESEPNGKLDRLIAYLRDDELLLAARNAWLRGVWGIMAVTTRRVIMVSVPTETREGYAYELPVEAALEMTDGGTDDGYRIFYLHDYEATTKLFFTNALVGESLYDRLYWCVSRTMLDDRGGSLERADDRGVTDDFARFRKLKDAFDTGALDDDALRNATLRLFLGPEGHPPPRTV